MTDNIQQELDLFEDEILKVIFGNGYQNNANYKMAITIYGNKINSYISRFEAFMRPLMLDSGLVDSAKLKQIVEIKYPNYSFLIPNNNFRLVNLIDVFKSLRG